MTLGEYIDLLKAIDPSTKVKKGIGRPHSWRGSYAELAFEPVENTTAGDMLAEAESAVGKSFNGYTGGCFLMDLDTTIHIDFYGEWYRGSY